MDKALLGIIILLLSVSTITDAKNLMKKDPVVIAESGADRNEREIEIVLKVSNDCRSFGENMTLWLTDEGINVHCVEK